MIIYISDRHAQQLVEWGMRRSVSAPKGADYFHEYNSYALAFENFARELFITCISVEMNVKYRYQ